MTLKILAILSVVYVAFCAYVFATQRSMIYYPTPPNPSVPAETWQVDVDGATLRSWIVRREGRRALLYFGGNAEDVGNSVAEFAAALPDRTLVFVNYRGYGGSSGAPSERALVDDALALFDRLAADHDDIAVIGRSLGSGVAIQLAARRPVTSLVLVTPFDSLVRVGQAVMPWLPVSLLARDRYDSFAVAPDVKARVLVLIAAADNVVPPSHARALFAAFERGVATVLEVPGYGHNDVQAWPGFYPTIVEHLELPINVPRPSRQL